MEHGVIIDRTKNIEQFLIDSFPSGEKFTLNFDQLKPLFTPLVSEFKKRGTKICSIVGTNGKGESSHLVSQLLHSIGKKQALWTSPHIVRVTERFMIDQVEITESQLYDLIEMYWPLIVEEKLSYYTALFYLFIQWALLNEVEYLVLEAGLGGRLDAINYFDADWVLIPSISRDHQEILGKRLSAILDEKISVTRERSQLFTTLKSKYLNHLVKEKELAIGFIWHNLSVEVDIEDDFSASNRILARRWFKTVFGFESEIHFNQIIGRYELRRFVINGKTRLITFIGSHNTDGIRALTAKLKKTRVHFDSIILSFSKRDKRDLISMLKMIATYRELTDNIYLTSFNHSKALSYDEVKDLSSCGEIGISPKFIGNLESINWDEIKGESILVTGSYYFVGAMVSMLSTFICQRES